MNKYYGDEMWIYSCDVMENSLCGENRLYNVLWYSIILVKPIFSQITKN